MKQIFGCFLVLLVLTLSCSSNGERVDGSDASLARIDVYGAYARKEPFLASSIVDDIIYVRLETLEKSLINHSARAYISGETIVIKAYQQVLTFDLYSGKFLKSVGHVGESPGGFYLTIPENHIDEKHGTTYEFRDMIRMISYELGTGNSVIINTPYKSGYGFQAVARLDSLNFIAHISNLTGDEAAKCVVFDYLGRVVNVFPNYQRFESASNGKVILNWGLEGEFYYHKDEVGFKELFNDTLFSVSATKLDPRFVFYCGKFHPEYSDQEVIHSDRGNSFLIYNVDESDSAIIFQLVFGGEKYSCIYYKNTNKTSVSYIENSNNNGFIDDINGFIPFEPTYISETGAFVQLVWPGDIIEWFDGKSEKEILQLPENIKALRLMNEGDNPLIAIGTPDKSE